ncbi:MAG: hypothetical protein LBN71_04140 [Tannerella sp.]|jgi:hypothetical protein|nr:hypothetical protein [Tannerella sp.]
MRLKKYIVLYFLLPALLLGSKVHAQTLIDVSTEVPDILIGEQTVLHLTVTADMGKVVYWGISPEALMPVEIVAASKPDTTVVNGNRIVIKQDFIVTSFSDVDTLCLLPPFGVIDQSDTIYSNQIALKITTVPVNVDAPEEFYDIKEIWKPLFVLADYYPLIFGILLTLFLICVVGYIIQHLRNRKALIPLRKEEPKLPPYEEAIKRLDEIKLQKLWQQGRNKDFYTQLTDVLRQYIVRRYNVNAMEMTSYEILEIIQRDKEAKSVYDILKQVLHLADFVKFAKLHPLPDENELSLMHAYSFVNRTKVVEIAKPAEESAESKTNDSKLKEEEHG